MPIGFSVRIKLLQTYGDLYYVGLNKIEIYNNKGQQLVNKNTYIESKPYKDITHLKGMSHDNRSLSNLISYN